MAIVFKQTPNRRLKKWRIIPSGSNSAIRMSRRRRPTKSLRRTIKSIVNGLEETKQVTETIVDGAIFNGVINFSGECYNCIPAVTRGDTSYQRDGDKIQPMYLTLRFLMELNGGMPVNVHLFCLEDKLNRDGNSSRDYNFLNLNGTDTNFDGSWVNSGLPVNTEDFKVIKRKKIRLAGNQYPGGTATAITESGKIFKEVKIKIPIKKLHKYLDYWGSPSSNSQPKNANIFWALGYVNADGTVDSVTTRVRVTCVSTLYYKDS